MDNNNSQIDKWKKRSKRFGLTWLLAIIAVIIVSIIAGQQSDTTNAVSSWVSYTFTVLLVINAVLMVGFLFSKIAFFVAKRRAPKGSSENPIKSEEIRPTGWRAHKKLIFIGGVALIMFLLFLFSFVPENCKDAECFITAANEGKAANFQSTDQAGIEWSYQINGGLGSGQTFTKTLLRLDDKELPQIKEFLQGKSLTCELQGDFDERLVTSLFFGVGDNCFGELKENLGQLLFLL